MPDNSSNPKREAGPIAGDVDAPRGTSGHLSSIDQNQQAVENFSFEVSAAEAARLKRDALVDSADSVHANRHELPTNESASRYYLDSADQFEEESSSQDDEVPQIITTVVTRRAKRSWLTSIVLHGALILLLSLVTLGSGQKEEQFDFVISPATFDEPDVEQDLTIDAELDWEQLDEEFGAELGDAGPVGLSDHMSASELVTVSSDSSLNSQSLDDLGTLFSGAHSGLVELEEGPGANATASFFGTKVEGNRIVYVVDNSGGMRDGELETLVAELLKSVEALTPKQSYYVIFYSDALYPLFFPNAPQDFVRADEKNKRQLRLWLDSVEFCLGNVVDEALKAALSIRPDVVYLLTDGDLDSTRDQRRMEYLLHGTGGTVPIHTIGMGTGTIGAGATKLKQVAEANGGSFRAVDIEPKAKELADAKDRPYHNKGPGSVWGQRVRSRR